MRRPGLVELADLIIAAKELALARQLLRSVTPAELLTIAYRRDEQERRASSPADAAFAKRVGVAIGRMSSRVPWRATCLVQALAGRRWLARRGISSSLFFGVRKAASRDLEAHAWLVSGCDLITGGDIVGYQELLSPEVISNLTQMAKTSGTQAQARTTP